MMETNRLLLRPWHEDDAEILFKYASDPDIGNAAGWLPHTSVEMSRQVICDYFSAPETYAVVLRDTNEPVGCCGLVPPGMRPNDYIGKDDAEIGYWIGKPYWGQGLIPEAVNAIIIHAFSKLKKKTLWIGFYPENIKSRRVAEKCGFRYHHEADNEVFFSRTAE
ncbi:MAG: GNAT family N-acetyltransferase [Bacteroidales bacterium]|nr:GNAT family N-acetyltransferase [Bacteroidales bacterium]MCM1147454.1 GNAT family N-acetyltransferase [Bacteroidales bacterium]MCM1206123.1 GNAT family N-acetyltransferase [Bacillota bacterium]MCM1510046.1 GNAT family N-acetyltransferase [Clostridium sp.]